MYNSGLFHTVLQRTPSNTALRSHFSQHKWKLSQHSHISCHFKLAQFGTVKRTSKSIERNCAKSIWPGIHHFKCKTFIVSCWQGSVNQLVWLHAWLHMQNLFNQPFGHGSATLTKAMREWSLHYDNTKISGPQNYFSSFIIYTNEKCQPVRTHKEWGHKGNYPKMQIKCLFSILHNSLRRGQDKQIFRVIFLTKCVSVIPHRPCYINTKWRQINLVYTFKTLPCSYLPPP